MICGSLGATASAPIDPVGLAVEDRHPRASRILRLPNAAVGDSDVKHVGLLGDAGDRDGASAAHGSDETPVQRAVQRRRDARRARRRACERDERERGRQCGGAPQSRLPLRRPFPRRLGENAGPIFHDVLRGSDSSTSVQPIGVNSRQSCGRPS